MKKPLIATISPIFTMAWVAGCAATSASGSRFSADELHRAIVFRQPPHNMLLVDEETISLSFADASKFVGQPCTCAAAGFRIAQLAVETLVEKVPATRGELLLVASKEHAISDVIAFLIGASQRTDPDKNSYLVDEALSVEPGVWRYVIADPEKQTAVEIAFEKWVLMPDPLRSRLRQIEEKSENGIENEPDRSFFRKEMERMVEELLDPQKSMEYLKANRIDWRMFSEKYPDFVKKRS